MFVVLVALAAFILGFLAHFFISVPGNIRRNRELAHYRQMHRTVRRFFK